MLHKKVYTKSVLKCTCNSTITLQGVNLPEYGLPMEVTNLHQISAEKHCQLYVYSLRCGFTPLWCSCRGKHFTPNLYKVTLLSVGLFFQVLNLHLGGVYNLYRIGIALHHCR